MEKKMEIQQFEYARKKMREKYAELNAHKGQRKLIVLTTKQIEDNIAFRKGRAK